MRHFFVQVVAEEFKFEHLYDLCGEFSHKTITVCCNTCRNVNWLTAKTQERGVTVCATSSDMDQPEHVRIAQEFEAGSCTIMITTTGLHWPNSDVIAEGSGGSGRVAINYDLPINAVDYAHCFRQCGGMVVIHLVTATDVQNLTGIMALYDIVIEELPRVPVVEEPRK